jgi:hypothetical protein
LIDGAFGCGIFGIGITLTGFGILPMLVLIAGGFPATGIL